MIGPRRAYRTPRPHPSGVRPPDLPKDRIPRHIAIVMDGNGRWARQRGLPRTKGHMAGEDALLDTVEGAIELGVRWLSAYGFSTENWRRPPDEVRFLMRFVEEVFQRRADEMDGLGVRLRWAGRPQRLWRSVIRRLEDMEERTRGNDVITLCMCVNYGGRAEIADAMAAMAADVAAGRLSPSKISEKRVARYLYDPEMPDVDLLIRTSGEQRISNFLLWQAAYAEFAFVDTLWPDFDRRELWRLCEEYAHRERRFGTAPPNEPESEPPPQLVPGVE